MYLESFSSSGSKVGFHAMVAAVSRVNIELARDTRFEVP